ncbi:MAG: DUF4411 family protein [Limnochordia bacterium]
MALRLYVRCGFKSGELKRGKDDLWDWARTYFTHGFTSTQDKDIIESYGRIADLVWKPPQQYTDAA